MNNSRTIIFCYFVNLYACGSDHTVHESSLSNSYETSSGEILITGTTNEYSTSNPTSELTSSSSFESAPVTTSELTSDSTSDSTSTGDDRDRLVFVTSKSVRGDFASEWDYDGLCNFLANEAGLLNNFKTWISTSSMNAIDRFEKTSDRYIFINGEVFVDNLDDLISGNLKNSLEFDENGEKVNDLVWTGTLPNGLAAYSSHCNDWLSKNDELEGSFGYSNDIDGQWTYVIDGTNPTLCGSSARLYCFEVD